VSAAAAELVDRAFDYRGYVTVVCRDGSELVGYLYDRGPAHVDLLDETANRRTRLARDEIADIRFTGDDPVQRSQEIWERRKGALEPAESPAYGEWGELRPVLVLVALGLELRHVGRALGIHRRGAFARGKLHGTDFVAHAVGPGGGAAKIVADVEPRLIVSCGFCGALDAELKTGDVVLATSVRDEGGVAVEVPAAPLSTARRALAGLRVFEGGVLCTTAVAATPAEKRGLARPGLLAVDMETHPVARAAAQAGIPWVSARAVIDPLEAELPSFARAPSDRYVVPALLHALSGPSGAVEVARLAARAKRAARSLEEVVRRLGAAFAARALP